MMMSSNSKNTNNMKNADDEDATKTKTTTTTTTIPIIDLDYYSDDDYVSNQQGDNNVNVVQQLHVACKEIGFFYLKGHGISRELRQAVLEQSRRLFNATTKSKQALCDKAMSRGYTAMEEETLDPITQKCGDTKEGFYIGTDIPVDDPRYNPAKFHGPNQWPDPKTTPDMNEDECQAFKSTMEEYFQQMSQLGFRVVRLIALSLGLEENYFDNHFTDPLAIIRLLHYSSKCSDVKNGVLGCGAHTDYGMITLLLTDHNPGLQILTKDNGEWINATHVEDAYVVNLGDMLERYTNGMYRSTPHRVVITNNNKGDGTGTGGGDRYSVPFFYEPNFDAVVKCLDVCCSLPDNPPKYPPTTSGLHLLEKYQQTHADFDPNNSKSTTTTAAAEKEN